MHDNERRLGRFKVAHELLYDLRKGDGANLFIGLAVLDVRHDFMTRTCEYFAWCAQFAPIAEGCVVPRYTAIFKAGEIAPTWVPAPDA